MPDGAPVKCSRMATQDDIRREDFTCNRAPCGLRTPSQSASAAGTFPAMRIEHVAWQVADPVAVAKWYVQHLGFTVLRKLEASPLTHFLADETGRVVVEIYRNPAATIPDYPAMNPLLLHLAFVADDPEAQRDRLFKAGATLHEDLTTPAGDRLIMMRDPFGFAIQLCKRAKPMI
jgi:uncharacterized glyoxalase superfamily protein PhnB